LSAFAHCPRFPTAVQHKRKDNFGKYWYSNHFKMASKFEGILRALKLKENGEVHYNMNFVILFLKITNIISWDVLKATINYF
jgi:hypothetical protein